MGSEAVMPAGPASRGRRLGRGLLEGAALAGAFWCVIWAYSDQFPLPGGRTIVGTSALSAALAGVSRLLTGGILGAVVGTVLGGVIGLEVTGRGPGPRLHTAPDARQVGQPARISGPTLHGASFDVSQHRGKVVLVDFWATWCVPCLQEMPDLVRLYHRYHAEGLEVVGVSHDNKPEPLTKYVRENNVPWPQIFHPEPEKRGGKNP